MGLEILVSILWIFNIGGPISPVTNRPCSDPLGAAEWFPSSAVGSFDFSHAGVVWIDRTRAGEIRPA
jgi:hypothetical protein